MGHPCLRAFRPPGPRPDGPPFPCLAPSGWRRLPRGRVEAHARLAASPRDPPQDPLRVFDAPEPDPAD